MGLVLCLFMAVAGGASSLAATENAPQSSAGTPAQKRIAKILTGRHEPAKLQLLVQLQSHRELLHAHFDVILEATRELLAQHTGHASAAEPDESRPHTNVDAAPVPESLSLLLQLLGNSPRDDAHAVLIKALDHPDMRIAMIAMDTIGEFEIEAAVDDLALQIKRQAFEDQYAFRFALVRAFARMHCPQSVEWLHRLSDHLQGQLHHEIATRLANVDLRDFHGDRQRYAIYREQHPDEEPGGQVRAGAKSSTPVLPVSAVTRNGLGKLQLHDTPSQSQSQPPSPRKLSLTEGKYYGIDLDAGRLLFIIDRSGSMRKPAYRETRLHSAKRELIVALEELAPETEFAIMLFDTEVQSWRSELLLATEENKRKAIEFVKQIRWGDRTNTYGVLSEALQFDDQLEAVFILTDGHPTAGAIQQPKAIIRDIVRRNRMRHLKFNTIGVGVNPATGNFLKTLADETGGEYRRVD